MVANAKRLARFSQSDQASVPAGAVPVMVAGCASGHAAGFVCGAVRVRLCELPNVYRSLAWRFRQSGNWAAVTE